MCIRNFLAPQFINNVFISCIFEDWLAFSQHHSKLIIELYMHSLFPRLTTKQGDPCIRSTEHPSGVRSWTPGMTSRRRNSIQRSISLGLTQAQAQSTHQRRVAMSYTRMPRAPTRGNFYGFRTPYATQRLDPRIYSFYFAPTIHSFFLKCRCSAMIMTCKFSIDCGLETCPYLVPHNHQPTKKSPTRRYK
jgi:hypothetical protein